MGAYVIAHFSLASLAVLSSRFSPRQADRQQYRNESEGKQILPGRNDSWHTEYYGCKHEQGLSQNLCAGCLPG